MTLQLQPPQLQLLLQDLVAKLDHCLLATAGRRRTALKVGGHFSDLHIFFIVLLKLGLISKTANLHYMYTPCNLLFVLKKN